MDASTSEAIRAVHGAMCEAMVAADAEALGRLLADDFTLTHMTGYRQTRAEWLQQVCDREMAYHRIEDVAVEVDASDPSRPVLSARSRTSATIWGSHGEWRLRLVSTFLRHGDGWVVAETVASTW